VADGLIDITAAYDQSGLASKPTEDYSGIPNKSMQVISFLFHHAERISREIMFMSSFELAYADYKGKGLDDKAAFDAATEKALKLTYDALFNYTQYNLGRSIYSI
jgi:hypothetical protein